MLRALRYGVVLGGSLLLVGATVHAEGSVPFGAAPPAAGGPLSAAPGAPAAPAGAVGVARIPALDGSHARGAQGVVPLVGGDGSGGKVIIVSAHGTGMNTSNDPQRTMFEVPPYSTATGEQVGRSTHNFSCATLALGYCDDIDTYHLPNGTIRSQARVSAAPDGQVQAGFLSGSHPTDRTLDGTGIFAGKSGTVRVVGGGDLRNFPREVTLDEIYVITCQ